ncbi:MAG TPA: hypothetical protein VK785_07685, partial [Opitutaceae bacterium]|nr:hypothetical protein [Opitutaceae bacterium]
MQVKTRCIQYFAIAFLSRPSQIFGYPHDKSDVTPAVPPTNHTMKYFGQIIAIVACLMAVNTLYAQDTPQATLTPSVNPALTGQTISFTISGSSSTGLGQIGLELCDASGTPTANLDYDNVSGTFASQT